MHIHNMRTALLFALLVATVAIVPAYAETPHDRLITSLIQVESHGNDHAIGDRRKKEKAYGPLQIRKPCVDDVNRRYGTKYAAKDMLGNRSLSVWVCQKYIEMYATKANIGREPNEEDRARIWNGGPNGWRSKSTDAYWAKVKRSLQS